MLNGLNPFTIVEPTNSFKIYSGISENYYFDHNKDDIFAVKKIKAGWLKIHNTDLISNFITGDSTQFKLDISSEHPIELNGYIMVTFPDGMIFPIGTQPTCMDIIDN